MKSKNIHVNKSNKIVPMNMKIVKINKKMVQLKFGEKKQKNS